MAAPSEILSLRVLAERGSAWAREKLDELLRPVHSELFVYFMTHSVPGLENDNYIGHTNGSVQERMQRNNTRPGRKKTAYACTHWRLAVTIYMSPERRYDFKLVTGTLKTKFRKRMRRIVGTFVLGYLFEAPVHAADCVAGLLGDGVPPDPEWAIEDLAEFQQRCRAVRARLETTEPTRWTPRMFAIPRELIRECWLDDIRAIAKVLLETKTPDATLTQTIVDEALESSHQETGSESVDVDAFAGDSESDSEMRAPKAKTSVQRP